MSTTTVSFTAASAVLHALKDADGEMSAFEIAARINDQRVPYERAFAILTILARRDLVKRVPRPGRETGWRIA